MFGGIMVLESIKKKTLFFCGLFSLFFSVLFFTLGLYVFLLNDLSARTNAAKNVLSERMDDIFAELKVIADSSALTCQKEDIDRLRRATFYSPVFKEFGLFNSDYKVYCSNLGPINISIYKSIVSRIKNSEARKTVSLMNSNTLGESTFFAFYQRPDGLGVNGLAPPDRIAISVDQILLPDYVYELTIGKQVLFSNRDHVTPSL